MKRPLSLGLVLWNDVGSALAVKVHAQNGHRLEASSEFFRVIINLP